MATEHGIVKVTWGQAAYPELEDQIEHMELSGTSSQPHPLTGASWQGYSVETRICPAKDGIAVSLCLVSSSRQREMDKDIHGMRPLGWVSQSTWDSRSQQCFGDEYVNKVDHIKGKDELGDSQSCTQPKSCLLRPHRATSLDGYNQMTHERPTCGRSVRFAEQPCSPCLRRKHGQGTKTQECRYKEYCKNDELVRDENRQKDPISEGTERPEPERLGKGTIPMVERESEKRYMDDDSKVIPQLHIAHGKKTPTFGLVSTKLNRQKPPVQEDNQDHINLPLLDKGPCTNKTVATLHHSDNIKKPGNISFPAPSKPETYLLQAGLCCLTGGRDRSNRVVAEVYGDHQYWGSPMLSSLALSKLLLYFHTIIRTDDREFGMTIVYDCRKIQPHPEFFKALQMVQDLKAIQCVLVLINKEKSYSPKKYTGDMEVVISLKGLHKYIEYSQLSPTLEGTFLYSHRNWLHLHQELYPFVFALKDATSLLLEATRTLEGVHKIATAQDVEQCINKQSILIKNVLEDTQLVTLQREGGTLLARLRWEGDVRASQYETSWNIMDIIESLYNEVEEHVHVLVRRSNISFQHLGFLLHLRKMESRFMEIKEFFDMKTERQILKAASAEEPSRTFEEILQCLTTVISEVDEQKLQTITLLNEAENIQGSNYPESEGFHIMITKFRSILSEFLSQAEHYCDELNTILNLCHFCKMATEVAVDCSQQLKQERWQFMNHQEKWATLQGCHEKLSQFSREHFQETKTQACSLQNPWGKVWNMTWLRCQKVSRQLEDILQELEQDQHSSVPLSLQYEWHGQESSERRPMASQPGTHQYPYECPAVNVRQKRDSIHGTVSCFNISFRQSHKGRKGSKMPTDADTDQNSPRKPAHDYRQSTFEGSNTVGCQWLQLHHNSTKCALEDSPSPSSSSKIQNLPSTFSDSKSSPPNCSNSQMSGPAFPGTQASVLQDPPSGSFCLEAFGCEARQPENTFHSEQLDRWGNEATNSLSCKEGNTNKLQRIMDELLLTEVEYVRSLGYILDHYLPLLSRPDVPPDLRGQRGRIFGNLEKLYDFHCHYFLQELEGCQTEPLLVGRCFLKYKTNFGLYALYSKNKPQSDALIQQHKFFKCKQLELGDSMDLSSYLLKPVQRISKYSLLLQEMLEECGILHEAEGLEIQGAAKVVQFQLRHGNDLLTMDSIQDSDVNLQEQGQLIRQDELYVTFCKKRTLRRVFLFRDLILFTKTKKTHRGDEVYVYKQSFKTCDIGLTKNCGQSGLCFEIWFRRRRVQHTYMLQAERQDIKEAWTSDLEHILWGQALTNRELRRQEQVFMGMSSKPFVKIQPRETGIHDRTVTCFLQDGASEGLKSLNLTAPKLQSDTLLTRPESIGSTAGSQSSSSSGRGSLSPSGLRENQVYENRLGPYTPLISHQNNQNNTTKPS